MLTAMARTSFETVEASDLKSTSSLQDNVVRDGFQCVALGGLGLRTRAAKISCKEREREQLRCRRTTCRPTCSTSPLQAQMPTRRPTGGLVEASDSSHVGLG